MRVAFRHFLLDREGALYRLPSAALDRMLQTPTRHRLPRLAGQRVRGAEVGVEMMNGHRRRLSRDRSSKPPWGATNAPEYHPPDPESNDCSTRSLGVVQNHNRPSGPTTYRNAFRIAVIRKEFDEPSGK